MLQRDKPAFVYVLNYGDLRWPEKHQCRLYFGIGEMKVDYEFQMFTNLLTVEHTDYQRPNEGHFPLPTQVLHVGNDGADPSLYESNGDVGRWATLSYCWGKDANLVLNKTTYSDLLKGMRPESFPFTIRDAIITTRALGIQYLWVDALCTKQDSKSDWEAEAPKMSRIYTNAAVMIVNASQGSANSGIFRDRDAKTRILMKASQPEVCISHKGLYARQDGLALVRTIVSGRLECKLGVWSTSSSDGRLFAELRDLSCAAGHFHMPQTEKSLPGFRTFSTSEIYPAWYSMIENYSKRRLSNNNDKIMAIAGLAKDVQVFVTDKYCVGLWENDPIAGLMWTWESELWSDYENWGKLFANSNQGLPSWGWASINNEVDWRFKRVIAGDTRQGWITMQRKMTEQWIELAKIEEVKIEHGLNHHYGSVDSCELVMTAPTYSLPLVHEESNQTWPEFHTLLIEQIKADREFQKRHQEHLNQPLLVQQLARIDNEDTRVDEGVAFTDFVPARNWALLVLETVENREIVSCSLSQEPLHRRVCLLFCGDVIRETELIEHLEWPMMTVSII
ncbi:uncharacterized protein PAC_12540 [Phialocephala subalpina]|uniref:Heterokaryon incompatibility domain-containing protein n=1 Tax=Phialocephala subalpina TaxID=576137 RepID=A0A1L7XC99_9HELO|nr:uncharacterized protein PAC_12540 [Phialocephala subalpina]